VGGGGRGTAVWRAGPADRSSPRVIELADRGAAGMHARGMHAGAGTGSRPRGRGARVAGAAGGGGRRTGSADRAPPPAGCSLPASFAGWLAGWLAACVRACVMESPPSPPLVRVCVLCCARVLGCVCTNTSSGLHTCLPTDTPACLPAPAHQSPPTALSQKVHNCVLLRRVCSRQQGAAAESSRR
jgi:hypothetical protein